MWIGVLLLALFAFLAACGGAFGGTAAVLRWLERENQADMPVRQIIGAQNEYIDMLKNSMIEAGIKVPHRPANAKDGA